MGHDRTADTLRATNRLRGVRQGGWVLYTEVAFHNPKHVDHRAIVAAWGNLKARDNSAPLLGTQHAMKSQRKARRWFG